MVEWLVYFCLQRRRKYTVVYLDKSDGYEIQILYFDSFRNHTIFRLDAHYSQTYLCAITK